MSDIKDLAIDQQQKSEDEKLLPPFNFEELSFENLCTIILRQMINQLIVIFIPIKKTFLQKQRFQGFLLIHTPQLNYTVK